MERKRLGKQLRVQVLARDGYRCRMCGRSRDVVELEADHVVALADGGTDELSNLATLCRDCNVGKSAYRFSDYRSINIAPDDLPKHFRFLADDVTGDFRRFHLYLYFKHGVHAGPTDDKFHHDWTIPGTTYDASSDPIALVARSRAQEEAKFLVEMRRRLIADRCRLVVNEEGVCRVEG